MAAALALVLAGLALAQSEAIGRWLGVRGIKIQFGPAPRAPIAADLRLGRQVSLAGARSAVPFNVLVPAALGEPDEVYLSDDRRVSLIYRARPNLPRARETGVGLLVTEFQAEFDDTFFKKVAPAGMRVEPVIVNSGQGYWISGAHVLYYRSPTGVHEDVLRVAGSVLVWERDGVTYRLESALTKDAALRIAESMR